MNKRKQPYLPLYVQDYLTDEKLNECSAAATGVLSKLMCVMHKSDEYGKILLRQKLRQNDRQVPHHLPDDLSECLPEQLPEVCRLFAEKLTRHLPWPAEEIAECLLELLDEKVLHLEGQALCQKRMIEDNELSIKRAAAGAKGASVTNKKFAAANAAANGSAKPPSKPPSNGAAKESANAENEIEIENTYSTEQRNNDVVVVNDSLEKPLTSCAVSTPDSTVGGHACVPACVPAPAHATHDGGEVRSKQELSDKLFTYRTQFLQEIEKTPSLMEGFWRKAVIVLPEAEPMWRQHWKPVFDAALADPDLKGKPPREKWIELTRMSLPHLSSLLDQFIQRVLLRYDEGKVWNKSYKDFPSYFCNWVDKKQEMLIRKQQQSLPTENNSSNQNSKTKIDAYLAERQRTKEKLERKLRAS